jgi:hypothetical protein
MKRHPHRVDVSNARARLAAADEYRRAHAATIAEGEQAKIILHRKQGCRRYVG